MHPAEWFVPLHFYLLHALDLMYDHLRKGKALPPSQVISSTASRGRTAEGTVPPIGGEPPRAGRIIFSEGKFVIPE